MPDAHALPTALAPALHEHGLATGDHASLAATIDRAWELFERVIAEADLDAPSRKQERAGRDLVARHGQWDFGRRIEDTLADAHNGEAHFLDVDALDAHVLAKTHGLDNDAIRASIAEARSEFARWLASDGPAEWGLVPTSSQLGPLPLLTVVNAMTYELAIAALDLEPCGTTAPDELLAIGLTALVDTTGAMAARKQFTGSFLVVTPERALGVGSQGGFWRTAQFPEDPMLGPGVIASTRNLIDATSGRANVPHLYRSGALQVRDLPGLVRLAPVLEGVPGLPPLGAVGRAIVMVDRVGGLFGRFRR